MPGALDSDQGERAAGTAHRDGVALLRCDDVDPLGQREGISGQVFEIRLRDVRHRYSLASRGETTLWRSHRTADGNSRQRDTHITGDNLLLFSGPSQLPPRRESLH